MIRLRTLGSVELEAQGGEDVRAVLAQPKRLALLIYLAAARPFRVHRRDDILALFWPDLDDTRARDALNQALRFLRQAIGAEAFVKRGAEDVGLNRERVWCDSAAFQDAVDGGLADEALELYRGEFLHGFFIEEGGGFEDWAEGRRRELRELASRGSRELADLAAEQGNLTQAVRWGKRALELMPDDERALRRLLRWYDRAGDRAGAFRAYEAFAKRFAEEFGAPLSGETKALVERLRTGRPLEDAVAPAPAGPASSPAPPAERYRIEGKLGEGGMATVYRARDLKHDRDVALKVLKPRIAESVARERFIREIRIAGRLQHPNIVPLFDSGELDGKLFYVMPHVEGETLRERIRRQGKLDIPFVVHVLREVAGALAYAHQQGVVHRDIKPDNILLIDRRALLTDFGIARAAQVAHTPTGDFDPTLTQPGTGLGTPAYMAPEQASGDGSLDARADLYALGAVAYEMLTGQPPFTGASPQELLAAQLTRKPDPVERLRPDVPPPLAELLVQCLEKQPEARPGSATALLEMVERWRDSPPRRGPARRRLLAGIGLGVAAAVGVLVIRRMLDRDVEPPEASGFHVDSTRYAVLPFARAGNVSADLPIEQSVQDAFARWDGITLVDRFQIVDAMSRRDSGALSVEEAGSVARALGAGRYIRGEIFHAGDSLRIHAGIYDAVTGARLLGDGMIRVSTALTGAESSFDRLADRLLFAGGNSGTPRETSSGTRSVPARWAYDRGHQAIQQWELGQADAEFDLATRLDSAYVQAHLWLALVRNWRGLPSAQWRFAAARAAAGRQSLARRDQVLADAVFALGESQVPRACRLLHALTVQEPHDFAAWYGMGACFARDSVVERNPRSRSGWAFRSSYAAALRGYTTAFELMPSIHKSLVENGFAQVRSILKTSAVYPRTGISLGTDTLRFAAYVSLEGDTITFVPVPVAEFYRSDSVAIPPSLIAASKRQKDLFHRIAAGWAVKDPQSPVAMEALATALELLGDPACLDTLHRAQALARVPSVRLRLAGLEVWMRLKHSLPGDADGLRRVAHLADSLLRLPPPERALQPELFISLAVLRGKANLAATLTRDPRVVAAWDLPPALGAVAAPLLSFAALGGPMDSLADLTERLGYAIGRLPDSATRRDALDRILVRAITVAGQVEGSLLSSVGGSTDYLLGVQQAFARGDTGAVRSTLRQIARARRAIPAEDLAPDALLPEAWLLDAVGDAGGAADWLDQVLMILPRTPPQVSADPVAVGALLRASVFRAALADRLGDAATATRWARAISILWSDADPFLRSQVARLPLVAGTKR
jgi:DNA-binding SARP family transcriptional activator/tRNA A-37 threonylcarbamoyl transferase component Bud32